MLSNGKSNSICSGKWKISVWIVLLYLSCFSSLLERQSSRHKGRARKRLALHLRKLSKLAMANAEVRYEGKEVKATIK